MWECLSSPRRLMGNVVLAPPTWRRPGFPGHNGEAGEGEGVPAWRETRLSHGRDIWRFILAGGMAATPPSPVGLTRRCPRTERGQGWRERAPGMVRGHGPVGVRCGCSRGVYAAPLSPLGWGTSDCSPGGVRPALSGLPSLVLGVSGCGFSQVYVTDVYRVPAVRQALRSGTSSRRQFSGLARPPNR